MHRIPAFLLGCALLMQASWTYAQTPPEVTLASGYFDDGLMLAADRQSGKLSGYYDDGHCRVYFEGPLTPTELYQRADFGEAYTPEAVLIGREAEPFTTEIYSRAKGGYRDQITLEPHLQGSPNPCRRRITRDRSSSVAAGYDGVRVILKKHIRLYKLVTLASGKTQVWRDWSQASPLWRSGVWLYGEGASPAMPAGYVHVAWYEHGAPRAGYVKAADLYPY